MLWLESAALFACITTVLRNATLWRARCSLCLEFRSSQRKTGKGAKAGKVLKMFWFTGNWRISKPEVVTDWGWGMGLAV